MYDVIIIGGGPAGSTLAARLEQLGRHALVLERERFPRFHIGESLLPCSCEVFDKLGVTERLEERFVRKYGATFICSDTGRERRYRFGEAFDPRFGFAYQVPRADFDALLLDRAAELGAEIRQAWRVMEVLFEGERAVGVRARPEGGGRGDEVEIRAPMIADASGRDSLVAARCGRKKRLAGLDKTALFSHWRNVPRLAGEPAGDIRIIVHRHGWFWIIPFKGDVTSVGTVVSSEWIRARPRGEPTEAFFARTAACSPPTEELLASAERISPVGTTADFSYGVESFAGAAWICVGDATGFIDPLFSTGAHLALKGADIAAQAIDRALTTGDTSRAAFVAYEDGVRRAASLFLGIVQAFYDGGFREQLFEASQRRTLTQLITTLLSGDVFHAVSGDATTKDTPRWVRMVLDQFPARYDWVAA